MSVNWEWTLEGEQKSYAGTYRLCESMRDGADTPITNVIVCMYELRGCMSDTPSRVAPQEMTVCSCPSKKMLGRGLFLLQETVFPVIQMADKPVCP